MAAQPLDVPRLAATHVRVKTPLWVSCYPRPSLGSPRTWPQCLRFPQRWPLGEAIKTQLDPTGQAGVALVGTIPGVGRCTAEVLVAEIGPT